MSARIWDAGDVRNLALMCDLVHGHDALAAIELWHGGPTAPRQETRGARHRPVPGGARVRLRHVL